MEYQSASHGKGNDQVQFNLGQKQLMIIGDLLQRASNSWLSGELENSFYTLKKIKGLIISRLKEQEIKQLEKHEDIFSLAKIKNRRDIISKVHQSYEESLMKLLEKRGFLTPLKEDRSKLFGQKQGED